MFIFEVIKVVLMVVLGFAWLVGGAIILLVGSFVSTKNEEWIEYFGENKMPMIIGFPLTWISFFCWASSCLLVLGSASLALSLEDMKEPIYYAIVAFTLFIISKTDYIGMFFRWIGSKIFPKKKSKIGEHAIDKGSIENRYSEIDSFIIGNSNKKKEGYTDTYIRRF